jgi:hypothetical protein
MDWTRTSEEEFKESEEFKEFKEDIGWTLELTLRAHRLRLTALSF